MTSVYHTVDRGELNVNSQKLARSTKTDHEWYQRFTYVDMTQSSNNFHAVYSFTMLNGLIKD